MLQGARCSDNSKCTLVLHLALKLTVTVSSLVVVLQS